MIWNRSDPSKSQPKNGAVDLNSTKEVHGTFCPWYDGMTSGCCLDIVVVHFLKLDL